MRAYTRANCTHSFITPLSLSLSLSLSHTHSRSSCTQDQYTPLMMFTSLHDILRATVPIGAEWMNERFDLYYFTGIISFARMFRKERDENNWCFTLSYALLPSLLAPLSTVPIPFRRLYLLAVPISLVLFINRNTLHPYLLYLFPVRRYLS